MIWSTRALFSTVVVAGVATIALAAGVAASPGSVPGSDGRTAPAADLVADGAQLFGTACAACHGDAGGGGTRGPSLVDAGAASADFYLRTGRMPLAGAATVQAVRKPPAFDDEAIRALVAYVASLGSGPEIPIIATDEALLVAGRTGFIANCAPCHGASGTGGAVGGGALAPPLDVATPVQVGEAMLIGPGQMPRFDLADDQLDAIATYVAYLQTAPNPGGFSIGGIGPVPEGFVAWVAGIGALLVAVVLIGREWRSPTR